MNWYENRGYIEDPFSTKNGVFVQQSVNLNDAQEELAYNIEAGNMVLIEGKKGTGKTTLLFSAIERFKGERKVIYFDCGKDTVDIKKLMQSKYGIIGRLLNLTPKGMILMLDNFTQLDPKDLERAKYYFDNNYLRSIIFTGNGSLPENVLDRIGHHIIKLKPLTSKDAILLVKNRLGSFEFLPEKIVKKIYAKSGNDTITFLENCSKVCGAAVESQATVIGEEHFNILGEKK